MRWGSIVLGTGIVGVAIMLAAGKGFAFPDEPPLLFLDRAEDAGFPLTAARFLDFPERDQANYWQGALQATAYLRDTTGLPTTLSACGTDDATDILTLRIGFAIFLKRPKPHSGLHKVEDLPRLPVVEVLPRFFEAACEMRWLPVLSPADGGSANPR